MQQAPDNFRLPDTLSAWPYPRRINPFYHEVKEESTAWQESFHAFDKREQDAFNRCDFNLCAALAYPYFNKEHLRTCADVLNVIFTFDEYSDREDEHGVRAQRTAIMHALRNPHAPRPPGECILGEMARQMWARALPTTPPHAASRFVSTFDTYTAAVVQEAEDRRLGNIRDIESYLSVRRGTVGVLPSFALLELDLEPDEEEVKALEDPRIRELEDLSVDLSILGNDMVSYIMERDKGHGAHNVVTAAMHELHTDVPGALKWLEAEHERVVNKFLEVRAQVLSDAKTLSGKRNDGRRSVENVVKRYVWGVGNWVRAIDCWYFESERYFGEHGRVVQTRRWVNARL